MEVVGDYDFLIENMKLGDEIKIINRNILNNNVYVKKKNIDELIDLLKEAKKAFVKE